MGGRIMNQKELPLQMDALIEKYSELLLGNSEKENQEKIKMWIIYTHISKSMPALAKHWNELYPTGKQDMISLIQEIKQLNEIHRAKQQK